MQKKPGIKAVTAVVVLLIAVIFLISYLKERRDDSMYAKQFLPVVDNAVYEAECAICHFMYLPGLLPSQSWTALIDGSVNHFGHELMLSDSDKEELKKYLTASAAENTGAKRSGRILDSLNGEIPLRITEVPYIKRKHRGVRRLVFKRESIRSFSNCIACHTSASEGNFKEANVVIPK